MGCVCFQPNQQHLPAVGYDNEKTRSGFNFYTPVFRAINADVDENGSKLFDIQEIQLDDSVSMFGADIQRIGSGGVATCYYLWFDKMSASDFGLGDGSKGVWANEDFSPIEEKVMLKEGDGVQINLDADQFIRTAGEVSDADITYLTRSGFNYVGNAYPSTLDIQDIQLDDSVTMFGADLQRIGSGGVANCYYLWFDKASAFDFGLGDGSKGVWANEDFSPIEEPVILNPGETIQVNCDSDVTVTVLSPIEL